MPAKITEHILSWADMESQVLEGINSFQAKLGDTPIDLPRGAVPLLVIDLMMKLAKVASEHPKEGVLLNGVGAVHYNQESGFVLIPDFGLESIYRKGLKETAPSMDPLILRAPKYYKRTLDLHARFKEILNFDAIYGNERVADLENRLTKLEEFGYRPMVLAMVGSGLNIEVEYPVMEFWREHVFAYHTNQGEAWETVVWIVCKPIMNSAGEQIPDKYGHPLWRTAAGTQFAVEIKEGSPSSFGQIRVYAPSLKR